MTGVRAWAIASALLAGGCSIARSGLGAGPDGGTDASTSDAPDGVDAGAPCSEFLPTRRVVAVLDADDFAAGTSTDAAVDEAGSLLLAPSPYRMGALLYRGFDSALLTAGAPSFDDLAGAEPTASALLDHVFFEVSAAEGPPSLLLARVNEFTVEAVGEVWLERGNAQLILGTDNRAIVELGAGTDPPRLAISGPTEDRVSFRVPEDDWYPIRLAWTELGGGGHLRLELAYLDEAGAELSRDFLRPHQLRADVSEVPGREMWGWDSETTDVDPDGWRITDGDSAADFGDFPVGIGVTSHDRFTVRWIGRHFLPSGGGTLAVTADDTFRLWVDGVFLGAGSSGNWDLPLPAGWYDVVLDLQERSNGSEYARLTHDGEPIAPERMRPYARFGGRPFGTGWAGSVAVGSGSTELQSLVVVAPEDPIAAVEVSALVETEAEAARDVRVRVETPWGAAEAFQLHEHARLEPGSRRWYFRATLRPPPDAARVADGTWTVELDNASTDTATWLSAGVLAHLAGDPSPYAEAGTFESAPIDLGAEHELVGAQLVADLPTGSIASVSVRAARGSGDLAGARYVPVTDGSLPDAIRGRFVQVKIEMTGDGADTPRVSDVRLLGAPCADCDPALASCDARALDGVVALYTFGEGDGLRVRDLSGFGSPLDLFVDDPAAVTWEPGALRIEAPTLVTSRSPAAKIHQACADADGFTLEAWIRPANDTQMGPARVLTISRGAFERNVTLGQEGDGLQVRLRTDDDGTGAPFLDGTGSVTTDWMHVVTTWSSADGVVRLFVDGEDRGSLAREGSLTTWDPSFALSLANEIDEDRAWLGDYGYVALYCRALDTEEIATNLGAGHD